MDYEFLNGFSPKLLDVVVRDAAFWAQSDYRLLRERTRLHILAFVHRGEGTLSVDGKEWRLRPHTLFQVWPGQRMQIETSREQPVCFYSVHYQYGLLQWEGVKAQWREAEGPLPFGDLLACMGSPELHEVFERMYRVWGGKDAGYEWDVKVRFLEAVRLAAAGSVMSRSAEDADGAAAVREAISYMKTHYQQELSRDLMAQHVGLSPAYFSSLFKKQTGTSPIRYLNRLRLDRAKQLLRQSGMPVKQVSEEVGFLDSFYFTRLFTKETGMSPREYRKA
ncbi:transcriptional regulator [Paenibacillus mucilaginosus 3016]|uniref:Transcriptional regulator n=1 Tax=Paenibacillus mucilaginosus 3016 TaxID=1116391 RepID=H6NCP7_9BACL|nr:AraC family transcriptional regulator [Paenibacillus mucilaginosus]AFC28976.1 transcriptional regulator [Paenibacillus mucilaginosus 3016]WFA17725.1 AraC family transcriptional regulator [Paenibacillus mucilaginosus]